MGCFRHLSRCPIYAVTLSTMLLVATMAFAEEAGAPPAKPPASPAAPAPPNAPTPPMPAKKSLTPKQEADGILGKKVFSADGADMGLVTNVLVDSKGHPIAVVVDFGGFLGVGTRKIAIDWHLMQFRPGDKKKPVTLSLQKGQLQAAQEYKPGKGLHIVGASAPAPAAPAHTPSPAAPAPDDKSKK